MTNNRKSSDELSVFMFYLARECRDGERLPSLTELAAQLGMSVAALREQLEIARVLGVVEVKPKTGIRKIPYNFRDSIIYSLVYAVESRAEHFSAFTDFRKHIEAAYWFEAVSKLTSEDQMQLRALVQRAMGKLALTPPQIPQIEHRELHLIMYRRLENVFVTGALEAFWDEYEAVGLDVFIEKEYLLKVWQYHQKVVDAICNGDFQVGHQLLLEHMDLLNVRPRATTNQNFE